MGKLINNPIAYTFAGIALVLALLCLFIGLHFSQTLQLIFIPYTYDITRGVGATGAKIFSIVLASLQIILIAMTVVASYLDKALTRRVIWGLGATLVVVYFTLTALGYLINNFH